MTKSKTLALLLSVLMCMALLVSCTSKNTQDKETDDVQITGDYIYKSDTPVRIIYNGNYRDEAIQRVQMALKQNINATIQIAPDTQEAVEHEIIIGKADRELSREAYRRLDMHETDGENYVGYVIYSDGKSLAVAYDEDIFELNFALNEAVDILIDKYLDGKYLQLKKGVVYERAHDLIAEQEDADKILVDEAWANLLSEMKENMEEEQAEAIYESLRNCYEIFSDDVITWFANLYDPEIGGYYYSNSGRNTVGYGPDLESTYQALSFMGGTGMGDTVDVEGGHDVIPEWMQEQIVKFVKSLQDKNGYFYHPQWGGQSFAERRAFMDKNYASRLGRDLKWAESLLKRFGVNPTYDTPTGMPGDGKLADGSSAVPASKLHMTGKLGVSAVTMVSKVIAASDDSRKHLESPEEMLNYLNSLVDSDGYLEDSYYAGNLLESQTSQIVARDEVLDPTGKTTPLATTIKNFFDSKQNKENGAWTRGDVIDYESVNGILKISGVYNGIGQEFPNPIKAIRTAMLGITMEEPPTTVCYVLNPWYAITMIIQNVEKYNSSPDKAQVEEDIKAVRAEITKNAVELIDVTRDKSAKFLKNDGSFSYFPGTSGPNSQGVPVAVVGSVEGDVNATHMFISGIPNHIFGILGYDMVPLFTTADRMRYWQILNDLGGIIKDDVLPPEPNDFEHEDIDTLPAGITTSLQSSGAFAKIVETVDKNDKETRAIAFRSAPDAADIIRFPLDNFSMYYNAISFEADIKFESGGGSGQIEMYPYGSQGDAYRIIFDYSDGGNVTARTINDFNGVTIGKEGEWIRLRLEYSYADIDYDRNGTKDLLVKLYADNKYIATGYTPALSNVLKEENVSGLRFQTWGSANLTMYVDNLLFMQDTVTLDPAPVINPEDESETLTFEQSKADNIPGKVSTSDLSEKGSITIINRATDSEKPNRALGLISPKGAADSLKFFITKPAANAYNAVAFESDMMIDSESGSFEYTFVTKFNSTAARLVFEWSADGVTVKAKNAAGTSESAVKIAELGKWFRVRIEFYGTTGTSLVRVLVGENVLMSSTTPYNTYHSARNVNSAKLAVKSDTEAEIYFDNLTYEQFAYVDTGASDTDADGITFEDVTVEGLGALMTVTTTDKAALDIAEDLRDGIVTKSLRLTSPKSSVDSIALKCKAENADETNTVVFESNIKISNADGSNFLNIYLKDKDGNTAYKLMWGWSAGTGNVFAQDITAAGTRDFSEVLVSEGIDDYFRLRVEYTKISDTEILGKIYINGVLLEKAKSITPFGTSAIDADDITELVLETDPGRGATFYFDNIKIDYTKTEVATPTPPTPPVTPDVPTEPGDRADTDPFDNDPESSSSSGGWT